MSNNSDLRHHSWLRRTGLVQVQGAIAAAGGELRVVGGAVRDALLGLPVGEIDAAVNLPPDQVMAALAKAGIRVIPTGLAHGTVTAVAEGQAYEITSLRRDVATDGRHAEVAFTDDWQADALRRDFTINALYVDALGEIYDYFSGREDLAHKRVRFIGDAEQRIREDILRIFRYFRFVAYFGAENFDAAALQACRDLAGLIPQLSAERVWRELEKLLAAPNPAASYTKMLACGTLSHFVPEAVGGDCLAGLIGLEKQHEITPASLRRFVSILDTKYAVVPMLVQRLKLPNQTRVALQDRLDTVAALAKVKDRLALRRVLYHFGVDVVRDALLVAAADSQRANLAADLATVAVWEAPKFPLQGSDLMELGIKPGPHMGEWLRAVEQWWLSHDCQPDKTACLAEMERMLNTR